MKRKGGKRESAHHLLSPAEAMLFNFDDPSASSSSKSNKSSSSKEKSKEKGKPPIGPVAGDRDGTWKRATGVLRDDGYFRVFGEVSLEHPSSHCPAALNRYLLRRPIKSSFTLFTSPPTIAPTFDFQITVSSAVQTASPSHIEPPLPSLLTVLLSLLLRCPPPSLPVLRGRLSKTQCTSASLR